MSAPTVVRRIRKRNATVTIEAHAGVLLAPQGHLGAFSRRMTHNVERFASDFAPRNKRPRWAHYGKPLKDTIVTSTQTRLDKMMLYSAIGSTAHYALFVEQGTKDFYAKILPPWARQSPSLYEHTWKVPHNVGTNPDGTAIIEWEELGRIHVRGQKAQYFMSRAVRVGLAATGMRDFTSTTVDGKLTERKVGFPTNLGDFVGATPWSFAFDVQLREWRIWRDRAWYRGDVLGAGITKEHQRREYRRTVREAESQDRINQARISRREGNRRRQKEWRDRQKARRPPRKPRANTKAGALQRATTASLRYMAQFLKDHPGAVLTSPPNGSGFTYTDRMGKPHVYHWDSRIADLWADAGYVNAPLPKTGR